MRKIVGKSAMIIQQAIISKVGSTLAASACLFETNGGSSGLDGLGGGLCNQSGFASISNCYFRANRTREGGAICLVTGRLEMTSCTLASNVAVSATCIVWPNPTVAQGGVLALAAGEALVTASSFVGNIASGIDAGGSVAASGGAIWNNANTELLNCTVVANEVRSGTNDCGGLSGGGAIANLTNGMLTARFCTVASNQVSTATPVSSQPPLANVGGCLQAGASFTLESTILAGNNVSITTAANAAGNFTDAGHNLSSDSTPMFSQLTSRNNVDPKLGGLADNGGPTPTMALLRTSPALDAGGDTGPATDQRGQLRPGLLHFDIGAFELQPVMFYIVSVSHANGGLSLKGIGAPNQPFTVQESSQLGTWKVAGSGMVTSNGWFEVEVPKETALTPQFIRLKSP